MLQFLRTHAPGKSVQFSYVECETALIPHLSLWENLQMVVGGQNWAEAISHMVPECRSLASLIQDPHTPGHEASNWERFTLGLMKGIQTNSPNLLIDLNEGQHSLFNLSNLKRILPQISEKQKVFLSSTDSTHWVDISHGIIKKNGYKFFVEELTSAKIKSRHSA